MKSSATMTIFSRSTWRAYPEIAPFTITPIRSKFFSAMLLRTMCAVGEVTRQQWLSYVPNQQRTFEQGMEFLNAEIERKGRHS